MASNPPFSGGKKMLERVELALLACALASVFALQFYLLSTL
jgi:hypothetical protein